MMGAATAAGLGLAMSAMFIYLVLRAFAGNPAALNSTEGVSRHALWTAVIAFFASGTAGLENLWTNREPFAADSGSFENLAVHAAAPGFWLGVIYLIGQYTWPRHLQPVRSASLEVRSVKKVVPKYLAGALLLVTILSAAALTVAWNDSGAPSRTGNDGYGWSTENGMYDGEFDESVNPVNQPYGGATDEFGNPVDSDGYVLSEDEIAEMNANAAPEEVPDIPSIDGTRPGSLVGPYLAGGLALVLASVVGITTLVIRRPPLQSLDAEENDALRAVWINRLLRTAVIAVSGFGTMSLQYVAQGIRARATWDTPPDVHGLGGSHAEAAANWLMGASAVWMLLVIVAMAAWAPPRLNFVNSAQAKGLPLQSAAYSKARDFLILAQGAGVVLAGIILVVGGTLSAYSAGSFESNAISVQLDGSEPASDAGPFAAIQYGAERLHELSTGSLLLLSMAGLYLLVQLFAAVIVKSRLGSRIELTEPRTALLPLWFTIVVYCALAMGLASGTNFIFNAASGTEIAATWMLGIVAVTAALAALLYRTAARRPALEGASELEDFELRVVIAHRGARLLGGVSLIAAGILANPNYLVQTTFSGYTDYSNSSGSSAFQLICMAVGIALCFLPASTAYSRRASKPRTGVAATA
ncbi:hypothetical protein [Paeniglutamicibacter sp. NPDC091659]|uniref:hypothetical protein n=1 Tax=Paeniglutamicibacter sp. NPDC091659 TaxID=3364389 RepID=UPI003829CFF5